MKALVNVSASLGTTAVIASCGKGSRATSTTATTGPTEEISPATWGSGQTATAIAGVASSTSLAPRAGTGNLGDVVGSTDPQAATSLFSGKAKVDVGEAASPRGSWGRSVCVAITAGTGAAASIAGRMAASGTRSSSVAPRRSQRIPRVSLASGRTAEQSTDASSSASTDASSSAKVNSRCPRPHLFQDNALKRERLIGGPHKPSQVAATRSTQRRWSPLAQGRPERTEVRSHFGLFPLEACGRTRDV